MKIGIQCLAYNCAETFPKFIAPWLKLKETHDVKLWVGSGQFKIYKEMGCKDENGPTLELFRTTYKDDIDYLWTPDPDNPLSDHKTRQQCVPYMKEQDIDVMVQLDADEFYTWEDVQNFIKFIEDNPKYDTYTVVLKNLIGDGTRYEDWPRMCAARIKRHGGISHYYYDAHWSFRGEDGNNIEYRHPPVKIGKVPMDLVYPKHYTWTNNLNTAGPSHIKEKMAYQQKYYGMEHGCGWKWDEEKQSVELNDEYWEKVKHPKPQIKND